MENTEIKKEYDLAVELMKTITAIYDAIVEYKIHEVKIYINGESNSFNEITIEDVRHPVVLAERIALIYDRGLDKTKFNGITKPLEPGVLKLDFTR